VEGFEAGEASGAEGGGDQDDGQRGRQQANAGYEHRGDHLQDGVDDRDEDANEGQEGTAPLDAGLPFGGWHGWLLHRRRCENKE
jgi:hypothetical protein